MDDVEIEIRAAEQALAQALGDPDRTAWVLHYAEDAVFDAGGDAVVGRPALMAMAEAMAPLSQVVIRPLRTELADGLASVWCEASWTSGTAGAEHPVSVRGILVWRRQPDGRWLVAIEHIG